MLKCFTLLLVLFSCCHLIAQTVQFEEITAPVIPLCQSAIFGVQLSSSDHADVDNDGDLDYFCIGYSSSGKSSELYINDGLGNFSISTTNSFTPLYMGSVSFKDVDNDNDQDLLITGLSSFVDLGTTYSMAVSILYINNGSGTFFESPSNFIGLSNGDAAFFDMDGDLDFDLLLTGHNTVPSGYPGGNLETILYENDGSGAFSEVFGTNFSVSPGNRLEVADLDSDADFDVLIMNSTNSIIYHNDGNGVFTVDTLIELIGLEYGEVKIATINDDIFPDILMIGSDSNQVYSTIYYLNDGLGNFTSNASIITPVAYATFEFGDFDNDSDLDVIVAGKDANDIYLTQHYLNDGQGNFDVVYSSLPRIVEGSIELFDIDSNNTLDMIITGKDANSIRHADLFINNGLGIYSNALDSILNQSALNVSCGDVDLDGNIDIYLNSLGKGRLYMNTGAEFSFKEIIDTSFMEAVGHSLFDDIDSDGDIDIISSGNQNLTVSTDIYLNTGNGEFQRSMMNNLSGLFYSSITLADINNDGQNDLLITGNTNQSGSANSIMYKNTGGVFSEMSGQNIPGLIRAAPGFSDMDLDGDLDLLITGNNAWSLFRYENDGTGMFAEITENNIGNVAEGSLNFGDVDNDGDEDLIVSGSTGIGGPKETSLYVNDGAGNFTVDISNNFLGLVSNTVDLIDIDVDGDLDLFLTGSSGSSSYLFTELYLNDGAGNFNLLVGTPFIDVKQAKITFADLDQDLDWDIIIAGSDGTNRLVKIYRTDLVSTSPIVPLITSIQLYPNPSSKSVSIELPKHNGTILTLSNISGDNVQVTRISSDVSMFNFDVSEYSSGVYIVRLSSDSIDFISKLVIE